MIALYLLTSLARNLMRSIYINFCNNSFRKMTSINVKTLLFLSSADKCAKYWAEQGVKVLYITHEPMKNLPDPIGSPRTSQNLESFCLIHFMYLPKWQDLLKHCYSVHLQQNPASVIIVHELEKYCICNGDVSHDHLSLICASLLQAASMSATKNSKPSYVITSFNSKNCTVPTILCKSFFHNIWELTVDDGGTDLRQKLIKLTKLSQSIKSNYVKLFVFSENNEQSFLEYESAFEAVIQLCE